LSSSAKNLAIYGLILTLFSLERKNVGFYVIKAKEKARKIYCQHKKASQSKTISSRKKSMFTEPS